MKNNIYSIIILLIFFGCNYKKQPEGKIVFTKLIYNLDKLSQKKIFDEWVDLNIKTSISDTLFNHYKNFEVPHVLFEGKSYPLGQCYYKDNNYKIIGRCNGEFGGELLFLGKDTTKVFYLLCTCPLMVNYINNKYYITSALAHMNGLGKVTEISDPKTLISVPIDSLCLNWKSNYFKGKNPREIYEKLSKQGNVLIDTCGVIFNLFYPYKKHNFVIYSNHKKTYLGEILNKKIIPLDTLVDIRIYTTDDTQNTIKHGIYTYHFNNSSSCFFNDTLYEKISSNGDIYIKQDTIVIGYRYNVTKNNK